MTDDKRSQEAEDVARPYREQFWCRLFGHKYGPWADLGPEPMQYRKCLRGWCDGSDLRFKPREG